ncbi:MAG: Fic family protein [Deltaproteobacteria bacterium]|nr:Fic family protein [Deltaproteobacteria bacterium]
MKKSGRYETTDLIEAQFQPGSRGRVLKNLQAITSKREIERIETCELLRTAEVMIDRYTRKHVFTAEDICAMHREWLGALYAWAGCYRQVHLAKAGFSFASLAFIPGLIADFEKHILQRFTPCVFDDRACVIEALAVVHTELLLIHPFREGNGRLARLLAACMALQAGLPLLDFSGIKGARREDYFAAVRAGLDRNYEPMRQVFSAVVLRSLHNER